MDLFALLEVETAAAPPVLGFHVYLTPKQLEAYRDTTRHRILVCGRGSGKTTLACYELLRAALETPNSHVLYFSTTIKRGLVTVFEKLKRLNDDLLLGGTVKESGSITFPNGSKLVVTGAETRKLIDRWRGVERIVFVAWDECQDQDPALLEYGVGSVFLPRLNDPGVQGRILLLGTGSKPRGYYYRAFTDTNLGYSPHHWIYTDGPDPIAAEVGLQDALKTLGVDASDNFIRREFWADFNSGGVGQILKIGPDTLIDRADLPKATTFVIAADFGTVDACGVTVLGFSPQLPDIYLHEAVKDYALGASGQVRFAREVAAKYRPLGRVYMVGDGGGLGKALVEDLKRTEQFYEVEPAEKAQKVPAMRNLAAALATGKVRIPIEEESFLDELTTPEWDPDHFGERIKGHVPDRVDALLYAFRKAKTLHRYQPPPPSVDDPFQAREEFIRAQIEKYHRPRKTSRWR